MSTLDERMRMTQAGQLTWAQPDLNEKCINCRHIKKHPKVTQTNPLADMQCEKVFLHTKKQGVAFNARIAIACSKFER